MDNIDLLFEELEKEKSTKDIKEIDDLLLIYNQYGYFNQSNRNRALKRLLISEDINLLFSSYLCRRPLQLPHHMSMFQTISFAVNFLLSEVI